MRDRAAIVATALPAAVEPVSVTAAIRGSPIRRSTCAASRRRFGQSPSGAPASRKMDAIASPQPGVFGACFRTNALPAIIEGAAKRKSCQNGKFHGMIASTTPSGSYRT